MRHGSFIAPLQQLAHCRPMRTGHHKGLHRCVGLPAGARPESSAPISKHLRRKAAFCLCRLFSDAKRRENKRRHEPPRPNAQPRHRDNRHTYLDTLGPTERALIGSARSRSLFPVFITALNSQTPYPASPKPPASPPLPPCPSIPAQGSSARSSRPLSVQPAPCRGSSSGFAPRPGTPHR